jgi:transposase InsO family protein
MPVQRFIVRVRQQYRLSIMFFPALRTALLFFAKMVTALAMRLREYLRARRRNHYRRILKINGAAASSDIRRAQPKPAWVKRELLRLKALMPDGSCRKIGDCFNRRFERSRRMTVGKTYVSETIRNHRYEIDVLRREIKRRPPRHTPKNFVWAMDLTGKTDTTGKLHMLLGILDHGSRAALCLQALHNKSSWTLLGHLFLTIGQHGKPRFVRTDNESVFCSRLFRLTLFALGIRHQTTDLHCPWQNGRVERFFGTLKERLGQLAVDSFEALNVALTEFRFFYNHVRPHQHLGGATPAEAWVDVNPKKTGYKQEFWFEAWDGLLQGYYLRR